MVEMLVVVMIMGLLLGLAAVTAMPDERGRLDVEARRLAQLLDLAAQEARVSGHAIRWQADAAGYRFSGLRADGSWGDIDDDALRPRTLPEGMTITRLEVEARAVSGAMQLDFIPYDPASAFRITLALGRQHADIAATPTGLVDVAAPGGAG